MRKVPSASPVAEKTCHRHRVRPLLTGLSDYYLVDRYLQTDRSYGAEGRLDIFR